MQWKNVIIIIHRNTESSAKIGQNLLMDEHKRRKKERVVWLFYLLSI